MSSLSADQYCNIERLEAPEARFLTKGCGLFYSLKGGTEMKKKNPALKKLSKAASRRPARAARAGEQPIAPVKLNPVQKHKTPIM
jgi:hypothetical protein